MGNAATAAWAEIKSVVSTPLTQPMDLTHIFLVTGAVIVAAILWFRILVHLRLE